MCYTGLWRFSGNRPFIEKTSSSAAAANANAGSNPEYSILAIAGAMYLLLSIAAADLWAGIALCVEGHGSGGSWFLRRKAFGVCLVGTFVALIGASIRVLFYSSFENVELVIGAAAVLFIADVVRKQQQMVRATSGGQKSSCLFATSCQDSSVGFLLRTLQLV